MTEHTKVPKHTEGPWTLHEINRAQINIRSGEDSIALVYRHQGSPSLMDRHDEGDANAQFIVRAVNCHDELVAALKQCANALQWKNMPIPALGLEHIAKIAQEAIAKAEGKEQS